MFRIAAFARLGGVSAKLLRAWDALGLFRPVWVDPATGYRWYAAAQLPELRRILALRDIGTPLAELVALVEGGADLVAVLDRRRAALERERREVERRLAALDITVAASDGLGRDIVVLPTPRESIAALDIAATHGDVEAAFYRLEAVVRDAGRRASRPPGALAGEDDDGRLAAVFVPTSGPVAAADPDVRSLALPAARVAAIIHRGPYAGLSAARGALERWVNASGSRRTGPLRVRYLQFGAESDLRVPAAWLVERDADFVTELQQPIA